MLVMRRARIAAERALVRTPTMCERSQRGSLPAGLQIESRTFFDITTRTLQSQLNTTCFPWFGEAYVNHANVVVGSLTPTASNSAVQLHMLVDLFIVLRSAVLDAPTGVPAGATAPAGRVTLHLELRATGMAVSLNCVDVDLGSLGPAFGPAAPAAKAALIASAGSQLSMDFSAAFTAIGPPAPSTSRVEIAGSTIAIRFDLAGGPVSHHFPGLDWSLFLDGLAVERLAASKVPADFKSRLTGLQLNTHWRPTGSTAHVDVDYSGNVAWTQLSFSLLLFLRGKIPLLTGANILPILRLTLFGTYVVVNHSESVIEHLFAEFGDWGVGSHHIRQ